MKTSIRFKYSFLRVIFSLFLFFGHVAASEKVDIVDVKELDSVSKKYETLDIEEFTLSNGMKVILKNTQDDTEMTVSIIASGGFTSLSKEERASAELAGSTVLQSGVDNLSADNLSATLYNQSIDLEIEIQAFARTINANFPASSLENFCEIVQKTFVNAKLDPIAFKQVIEARKIQISHSKNLNHKNLFFIEALSEKEKQFLLPLSLEEVQYANSKRAEKIIKQAFKNPEEFICVITGSFDRSKAKNIVVNSLGNIPKAKSDFTFIQPVLSKKNKDVISKVQPLNMQQESHVRIAIPIQCELDCMFYENLELFCQILENRLNNYAKIHFEHLKGLDVWHELPFYPSIENSWIIIQFYVDNDSIHESVKLVHEDLQKIYKQGITQEELNVAMKVKKYSLSLWQQDNSFWNLLISNTYLWGWNPEDLSLRLEPEQSIKLESINKTMHAVFFLEQFKL